jgi:hypothetical protein
VGDVVLIVVDPLVLVQVPEVVVVLVTTEDVFVIDVVPLVLLPV